MKKALIFTTFIAIILIASGFLGQSSIEEKRKLDNFSKVNFGIAGTLYINIGSEFKVVLEGEKNVLEDVITEVSDNRLVIKKDRNRDMGRTSEKITVYITMPELESLGVSGSGKAEIKDALKTKDLSLSVSGSGSVYSEDIEAETLNCTISGSGDIFLNKGVVENAEIGISGSGNYSGESLEIGTADISISGSGNCTCNVKEDLNARVSGSGNVHYAGNPKIDARVSGSGKVRSL